MKNFQKFKSLLIAESFEYIIQQSITGIIKVHQGNFEQGLKII